MATEQWKAIRVEWGSYKYRETERYIDIVWPVRLTHTVTGRTAEFVVCAGSGWRPSAERIVGNLATYALYAFVDGDPDHGLTHYCRGDYGVKEIDETWCGELGHDPDDPHTRGHYTQWLSRAFLAAYVLGNLLSEAQDL